MSQDQDRIAQAEYADLAAAMERAAVDLGLTEEPSGFVAALEDGAAGQEAAS